MVCASPTSSALMLGVVAAVAAVALVSPVAASASVALESLEKLPSFEVPSFDYPSLLRDGVPARVLQALEKDGILALRDVPNYASLRERFLESAVRCALASERDAEGAGDGAAATARFLSTKFFEDGTKRLTLEATAGRELGLEAAGTPEAAAASRALAAKCPQYRVLHAEFSRALEYTVNTFGDALDRTAFSVSDGDVSISSRKLVSDAVRLDHFHVYEARSSASSALTKPRDGASDVSAATRKLSLSLPLHEDHGLFIAMVAPMFFTAARDGQQVAARRLVSDASGLVIRTADGRNVRPILKHDEVVIMMGSGASRWLKTSHRIPAVMHGMRMPEELVSATATGERSLRAWFGKMTLLPHYQRVLESRLSFGEFANRTTRYLLERTAGDLKTVGCATGRRLHDSGGSCAYRKCTLKKDPSIVPPSVGCHQACNYGTDFFNAKCEKKCDCEEVPRDGVICWMLCTERFPVDECPVENQVCDGLRNTCTLTTPAPAPLTPEPTSSIPTPEPVTPEPATSTPEPNTPPPTSTPVVSTPVPTTTIPAPVPTTTAPTPTTVSPAPVPATTAPAPPTATPAATASPTSAVPVPAATPEPTLPVRGQC